MLDDNDVTNAFKHLDVDDKFFFLRLPGVRSTIDRLLMEGNNGTLTEFKYWLASPLLKYINTHDELPKTSRWAFAGVDMSNPISDSYPFYTTAWKQSETDCAYSNNVIIRSLFDRHMKDSVGREACTLRECSADVIDRIDRCLNYLNDLGDYFIHDIIVNVMSISMIDYENWATMGKNDYREIGQSVSTHLVPSSSFFSAYSLDDDGRCLESLYHEGLHKKLSNTLIAFSILREGYASELSPKFHSFWNVDTKWNSNLWEFDRALYALHIYVHLAVLYTHVIEAGDYLIFSETWSTERLVICKKRALILLHWVADQQDVLTETGVWMIQQWRKALKDIGVES